jgi:hypothetical protein
VDQQQLIYNGALSVRKGTSQTFTVGITGSLTEVDLPLCTRAKGNTIVLEVKDVPGSPSDKAKITLAFTSNTYKCDWFAFVLPSPISVTAGEVMELLITRVKGFAPLWGANRLPGDPYPRGVGTWMGHTIHAFAFRTWVIRAST